MKTACNKDHICTALNRGDCDYMKWRSWCMCGSEDINNRCKNEDAWPENQPREDIYAPIKKLTKKDREDILLFAINRSKEILSGEEYD